MPRRSLRALLALAPLTIALAACGDSPTGPEQAARDMARRFDRIADSLDTAGEFDAAASASMMAEVLRMSDRLNTVTVSVDGQARTYHALVLQYRLPAAPPGEEPSSTFGQVVVGWKGEALDEGFAFLLDSAGTWSVTAPDQATSVPHVLGGLFEGGAASGRTWVATAGSVTSPRATEQSGCARSQLLPPTLDYTCRLASIAFRANVTLRELDESGDVVLGPTRTLAIDGQTISGLALTLNSLPQEAARAFRPRRLLPMRLP